MKILLVKLLLIPGDINPVICSARAVPLQPKNNFCIANFVQKSSHRGSLESDQNILLLTSHNILIVEIKIIVQLVHSLQSWTVLVFVQLCKQS